MFGTQKGDGIVEKNKDIIDVQHTMVEMHKKMLQKGSVLSGIIETDFNDKESLELAKYGFKQRYEGIANAYETPVLPEGYHYKDIKGPNAKDMDFANMDAVYTQKILDAFGVPKEVLGNLDAKGLANGKTAHRAFMEFTIQPIAKQIQDQLNEFLIPKLTDDPIFFDLDDVVPADPQFELEKTQASVANHA